MACENAINATDALAGHIRSAVPEAEWPAVAAKAASQHRGRPDRARPVADGLDVTVETYFEWAIERPRSAARSRRSPTPPGSTTWPVHRAEAVHRQHRPRHHRLPRLRRGIEKLSDALADDVVRAAVTGVLGETKRLLVAKHEFSDEAQQAYVDKILQRFANPYLPDTVERVGRQPLRKLSRNERLIGPAAELAERGVRPEHLLATVERRCRSTSPTTRRAWSCSGCCRPSRRPRRPSGSRA